MPEEERVPQLVEDLPNVTLSPVEESGSRARVFSEDPPIEGFPDPEDGIEGSLGTGIAADPGPRSYPLSKVYFFFCPSHTGHLPSGIFLIPRAEAEASKEG